MKRILFTRGKITFLVFDAQETQMESLSDGIGLPMMQLHASGQILAQEALVEEYLQAEYECRIEVHEGGETGDEILLNVTCAATFLLLEPDQLVVRLKLAA